MTPSPRWADAEAALKKLTPCQLATLRRVARLPLIHVEVLAQLRNLGDRSSSVAHTVDDLTDMGLIAYVRPVIAAGPTKLHYVTDLGLAALAFDWKVDVRDLAITLRTDKRSLDHLHLRARQAHHTYRLLGAVAACGGDEPCLIAWERPWLRAVSYIGPHSAGIVELPAHAVLTWPTTGTGSFLLLPDISTFPVHAYRPTFLQLLRWRESDEQYLTLLVVGTHERRRAEAIEDLAGEVREKLGMAPLVMVVATWSDLSSVLPSAIAQCTE